MEKDVETEVPEQPLEGPGTTFGRSFQELRTVFSVTNAVVKEGTVIRIEGKIPPDADTFSVNLGSDSENIALHFNPYFQDDSGVIYVNSMSKGSWQAEEIEKAFPFKKGTVTVLKVRVEKDMFVVEGPHNLKVEFPDRLHLPSITTIFIIGKFNLTAYDIH